MKFKIGELVVNKYRMPVISFPQGVGFGSGRGTDTIAGVIIDLPEKSKGKIIGYYGVYLVDFDGLEAEMEDDELEPATKLQKALE